MSEARFAQIRSDMERIRRERAGVTRWCRILGGVLFVLGLVILILLMSQGHPRIGGMLMALCWVGGFPLLLYSVKRDMQTEVQVMSLLDADMKQIAAEYVTFIDSAVTMPSDMLTVYDRMFVKSIHRSKEMEYRGVRVYLTALSLGERGEHKRWRQHSVLTVPAVDCGVQIRHVRARDVFTGKVSWCGGYGLIRNEAEKANDEAFAQIVSEDWTRRTGADAIEVRRWRGQWVVDIDLGVDRLLTMKKKSTDPEQVLTWYRHELNKLCLLLDQIFTLSIVKSE